MSRNSLLGVCLVDIGLVAVVVCLLLGTVLVQGADVTAAWDWRITLLGFRYSVMISPTRSESCANDKLTS